MANYMAIRVKKHIEHERTIFTRHIELPGKFKQR